MQTKYPDQFKLKVLEEYYASTLGVRSIALKFNLPSKNYINKWEKELIAKGLLPEGTTKPNKAAGRSKERVAREDTRTEREAHYEDEIARLKAVPLSDFLLSGFYRPGQGRKQINRLSLL